MKVLFGAVGILSPIEARLSVKEKKGSKDQSFPLSLLSPPPLGGRSSQADL